MELAQEFICNRAVSSEAAKASAPSSEEQDEVLTPQIPPPICYTGLQLPNLINAGSWRWRISCLSYEDLPYNVTRSENLCCLTTAGGLLLLDQKAEKILQDLKLTSVWAPQELTIIQD